MKKIYKWKNGESIYGDYLYIIKFNIKLVIEVLSSFIFSIGIGYVFIRSKLIILPMIGNFLEGVISNFILSKYSKKMVR